MMVHPAPTKKASAAKLVPIIGGFVLFGIVAVFSQELALALAIATIAFAAISMLIAITRKH